MILLDYITQLCTNAFIETFELENIQLISNELDHIEPCFHEEYMHAAKSCAVYYASAFKLVSIIVNKHMMLGQILITVGFLLAGDWQGIRIVLNYFMN